MTKDKRSLARRIESLEDKLAHLNAQTEMFELNAEGEEFHNQCTNSEGDCGYWDGEKCCADECENTHEDYYALVIHYDEIESCKESLRNLKLEQKKSFTFEDLLSQASLAWLNKKNFCYSPYKEI